MMRPMVWPSFSYHPQDLNPRIHAITMYLMMAASVQKPRSASATCKWGRKVR